MSEQGKPTTERKVKTLAIRLDPELHAQLSVVAQLSGSTITDEIREALHAHVAAKASSKDLAGAATELLEEIERDAAIRRDALAGLLGNTEKASTATTASTRNRGRKPSTPSDSATS